MNKTENTAAASDNHKSQTAKETPLNAKEEAIEIGRMVLFALVVAFIVRSFLLEPFNIPSSSMKPNLLVGDYLFVSKYSYGFSRHSFPFGIIPIEGRLAAKAPQRGDIIVFKLPTNTSISYIKRLIGLPGDRIQMKRGRLYINDQLIPREAKGLRTTYDDAGNKLVMTEYQQTLPGGARFSIFEESDGGPLDDTPVYTVPAGHYFMMGDNRDHSQDSRVQQVVGFVPFENLLGPARMIFFSVNGSAKLFEFWKWPWAIRYSRLFDDLTMHVKDQDVAGDAMDDAAGPQDEGAQ